MRMIDTLIQSMGVLMVVASLSSPAAAEPGGNPLSHRKATLVVQAAPGAQVRVEQLTHAFPFGTAISRDAFNGTMAETDRNLYLKTLRDNFNFAVHENALKWVQSQPGPDRFDYALADRMWAWCDAYGIGMRGHAVFWSKAHRTPDWAAELDAAALQRAVDERIDSVMRRYRGRIRDYDLNNEMLDGRFFADRLGEGARVQMFKRAHAANPEAVLYLNENGILTGLRVEAYVELIRSLLDAGAPVGGIGVQGHFEAEADPAVLKAALDRLAEFNLPIWVTEFDVMSADEGVKARSLEAVYRIAFEHPAVEGVMMWGFWAGRHWLSGEHAVPGYTALWDRDWAATPSATAYRRLVFGEWWSRHDLTADASGRVELDVFAGRYRVSVVTGEGPGASRRVEVDLPRPGATTTVDLTTPGSPDTPHTEEQP